MTVHTITTAEQMILEPFPKKREAVFSLGYISDATGNVLIRVGAGQADIVMAQYNAAITRVPIPQSTPVFAKTTAGTATLGVYIIPED